MVRANPGQNRTHMEAPVLGHTNGRFGVSGAYVKDFAIPLRARCREKGFTDSIWDRHANIARHCRVR